MQQDSSRKVVRRTSGHRISHHEQAIMGMATYAVDCLMKGEQITVKGLVVYGGIGGLLGLFGGLITVLTTATALTAAAAGDALIAAVVTGLIAMDGVCATDMHMKQSPPPKQSGVGKVLSACMGEQFLVEMEMEEDQ